MLGRFRHSVKDPASPAFPVPGILGSGARIHLHELTPVEGQSRQRSLVIVTVTSAAVLQFPSLAKIGSITGEGSNPPSLG